MKQKETMR